MSASDKQERIEVEQVNFRNHEQFIAQLKKDLPVGTSMQDVKAYLLERKIEYSYESYEELKTIFPDIPHQQNCFKFMIKKIDSKFFIFITDLQVKIFIFEEGGVSEIKYELIGTAF